MTVKMCKSKIMLAVLLLFVLVMLVACGTTSDTSAVTTEQPVTTNPATEETTPTTTIVTTTAPTTTTPATPEASDDAWMDKVGFLKEHSYPVDAYDEETGKYNICIFIQDIHNVGQRNAEAAFAEQFDLYYDPDYDLWQILDFRFIIQASKEEIEMYARLEEVEKIWFNSRGYNE